MVEPRPVSEAPVVDEDELRSRVQELERRSPRLMPDADRIRLCQALVNLLSNAARYTTPPLLAGEGERRSP